MMYTISITRIGITLVLSAFISMAQASTSGNYLVYSWNIDRSLVVGTSDNPVDMAAREAQVESSTITISLTDTPPPPGPQVWYTVLGGQTAVVPASRYKDRTDLDARSITPRPEIYSIVIIDVPGELTLYDSADETGPDSNPEARTSAPLPFQLGDTLTFSPYKDRPGTTYEQWYEVPYLALPDNSYITACDYRYNISGGMFAKVIEHQYSLCRDTTESFGDHGWAFMRNNQHLDFACYYNSGSGWCDSLIYGVEVWYVHTP